MGLIRLAVSSTLFPISISICLAAGPVCINEPGVKNLMGICSNLSLVNGFPGHTFHFVQWFDVKFKASGDAALFFGFPNDRLRGVDYSGWRFTRCEIDGGYNFITQVGTNSKWGVLSWALKNFVWDGGSIHDVKREHAFYHHNPAGRVTIRNSLMYNLGRTASQHMARVDDSGATGLPPNLGNIVFQNNIVLDTSLTDGGQAFTLGGRNRGTTFVQDNVFGFGFDVLQPGINNMYHPRVGSVLSWAPANDGLLPSYAILVRNNVSAYNDQINAPALWLNSVDYAWADENLVLIPPNTGRPALTMGMTGSQQTDHQPPPNACSARNTFVNGGAFYFGNPIPIATPAGFGAFASSCH